jgi:hypothetical protein
MDIPKLLPDTVYMGEERKGKLNTHYYVGQTYCLSYIPHTNEFLIVRVLEVPSSTTGLFLAFAEEDIIFHGIVHREEDFRVIKRCIKI